MEFIKFSFLIIFHFFVSHGNGGRSSSTYRVQFILATPLKRMDSSDAFSLRSSSPSHLSRNNSKNCTVNSSNSFLTGTTIYHQVEIRPRDSFKFFVRADNPLETLHFSFYTRKKSIGFGLFYLFLPNLSSSVDGDLNERTCQELPIEKVKELIGASRENVRLQTMRQEGPLARTLSTNKKSSKIKKGLLCNVYINPILSYSHSLDFLTVDGLGGSRGASTENLASLLDDSPQLSSVNSAQLKDSQKLKIGELIEIIPIKKYNSFEYTLEGSFTIPLTGTFVLLFDNSFSIGTSKHLFYHAYLSTDIVPSPSATPQLLSSGQIGSLCAAGWISKRRSGMVRSWSRRWFQLDSLGVLSYFEDRASPLRGSIFVPDCSLIIAKTNFKFSLDSGSQTFHLQAYKQEEFDFWIQVLSSFKHFGPPTTATFSQQLPSKPANPQVLMRQSIDDAFRSARESLDKFETSAGAGETLTQLESIYELLQKTKESLFEIEPEEVYSDVYEGEEEVFYDVEEIYVDDIEEQSIGGVSEFESTESAEEDSDVYEPVIEYEEPSTSQRIVTDWLLKADLKLPLQPASVFRTNMPFPAPPINISFSSVILKKSFPVALNEPINLLQRLAEEVEYSELLDRAASVRNDPIEQLVYVTAFAVSGYASSVHRSERKPYNPVLGETFEYIRPDRGYRFVAEKVSHQPVIVACHAESRKWRFWQDLQAETKLWVKSMLVSPKGRLHLELLDEETGEVLASFSWSKVSGALRNIQSSRKTIENFGEMIIKNRAGGLESRITFKESGMFSNSGNEINGGIYKIGSSSSSNPIVSLSGRWDEMLCKEVKVKGTDPNNSNNLLQVIWKTNPLPSNYAQFFCLTSFAITLNDFPDLLRQVLPRNDSRFRPDQRMLESGMLDAADLEKERIEQLQRDRRSAGKTIEPMWFNYDESSKTWKFNGKYWKEREAKFSKREIPNLW